MDGAATPSPLNPVALAQALVQCASVTPADAGALGTLEAELTKLGFTCTRLPFGGEDGRPVIDNLFARLGSGAPHLCFAGHTDVVPVGDETAWSAAPFGGEIRDGRLWGRGAADMKSAIAAFAAAVAERLGEGPVPGSISFLITGDEEADAVDGTVKVLEWMEANGHVPDFCIVGEPTNPSALGDMMKIGRRGSFTGWLDVHGTQGHTAYPHLADNPIHRLVRMLEPLVPGTLDEGTEHFPPTTVAISTVDTGNPTTNVIPAKVSAGFNIRFNDLHTAESLEARLKAGFEAVGGRYDFRWACSSNAFVTEPGALSAAVGDAVEAVTGRRPELSTTGGTSDARFIRRLCPVVEFGIVGQTMHKVDEHVVVDDINRLTHIYRVVIDRLLPIPEAV